MKISIPLPVSTLSIQSFSEKKVDSYARKFTLILSISVRGEISPSIGINKSKALLKLKLRIKINHHIRMMFEGNSGKLYKFKISTLYCIICTRWQFLFFLFYSFFCFYYFSIFLVRSWFLLPELVKFMQCVMPLNSFPLITLRTLKNIKSKFLIQILESPPLISVENHHNLCFRSSDSRFRANHPINNLSCLCVFSS